MHVFFKFYVSGLNSSKTSKSYIFFFFHFCHRYSETKKTTTKNPSFTELTTERTPSYTVVVIDN